MFLWMLLLQSTLITPPQSFTVNIEGPSVDAAGNLYAFNYRQNGTVARISPSGELELFVKLPDGSTGNGSRFAHDGSMRIADFTGHNILKLDPVSRRVTVLAHEARMHQPNDLAIASDDTVFASDPDWKAQTGNLWRISPRGEVTLLEANMGTTNGIEVSPDQRYLYVNESVQRRIWRYELTASHEVKNKTLLLTFPDFGLDGMRCDAAGHLWVARYGKGTILELTPDGKIVREIPTIQKKVTNLTFSRDGKQLFITAQDERAIETIRLE
jgi:gluconolactonase